MTAERRLRVLVTRPAADAAPLADRLRADGFEPAIEPLLAIVPTGGAVPLDGVQAVLLTSANGARALAGATDRRDLPLFAVGDATAEAAAAAGFARVSAAGGDVAALAALLAERLRPAEGPLLHVSGRDVAGDLGSILAAAGFAVRRAVLYRAEPAQALSPECRRLIAAGAIEAALFFSPRTGRSFVTLADQAGLAGACRGIAAFCLSRAVADAVAAVPWRTVRVADRPAQPSLLAALASWAAENRESE